MLDGIEDENVFVRLSRDGHPGQEIHESLEDIGFLVHFPVHLADGRDPVGEDVQFSSFWISGIGGRPDHPSSFVIGKADTEELPAGRHKGVVYFAAVLPRHIEGNAAEMQV